MWGNVYFGRYWGDRYWANGSTAVAPPPPPPPPPGGGIEFEGGPGGSGMTGWGDPQGHMRPQGRRRKKIEARRDEVSIRMPPERQVDLDKALAGYDDDDAITVTLLDDL